MNLNVYMQLLLLCVLNITFTFSGIILNALVIVSFGKSSQLRKKSCHFMIMVLSCFDLVSVVTNNPGLLFYIISWLMEKYDLLLKMGIYFSFTDKFFGSPLLILFVMNIERYIWECFTRFFITHR